MSSLYIDIKYARLIGPFVDSWKIKKDSPFHGTGRCPLCGDSLSNKSKCRFHVREHDDTIFVSCFNCGYSSNISGFLKVYHPNIYSDYVFEKYKVTGSESPVITSKTTQPTIVETQVRCNKLDLVLVSDLKETDPVRQYVSGRHLPKYPFMYAEKFYEFSSQYNPELSKYKKDEPRLIIPFFDRKGSVFAFQGRDLSGKSNQKYITITVDKKVPKIFGIDRLNIKKPITIVEGPIDSLFLPNCLAAVNAGLISTAKKLIDNGINTEQITIVYDNEPRNKEILKLYDDAITAGFKIVIWPNSPTKKEDINDLVLMGKDPKTIIEKNTFSGLRAKIEFQRWKRI